MKKNKNVRPSNAKELSSDVILRRDAAKDLSNKEYIKALIENDGITAPESLSEEHMLAMLNEAEQKDSFVIWQPDPSAGKDFKEKAARPKFMRFAALAACALIAVIGISKLYYSDLFLPDTSIQDGELYGFESRSEIERLFKSLNKSSPLDSLGFRFRGGGSEESALEEDRGYSAGEANTDSMSDVLKSSDGNTDHSKTYLQVDDVDEADIVKVDGNYIYAVSNKQEVHILEAADGKAKKVATIGSSEVENYIEDIFLRDNLLITIGEVYDEDEGHIAVVTYDIRDRSNPKLINQFRQSGSYVVSSRMIGNYIYLVTNADIYDRGKILPFCTIGGEYRELPPSEISCVPNPQHSSYVILSAIDISSGETAKSKTKAIFGATDEIYCNDHALYCTLSEWNDKYDTEYTRIIKADLDGLNIKFSGTALVRGIINNQFSMDERDWYFRIATTSDRNDMNVNNLFVLDSDLKEVGKVTGFARNESIKAVRFIGSKAYVITYEEIDPLFIIDLKDPENPKIEGEVMIDGFSTLLVPIAGGRLLGIGHATGDNGYGGEFDSGLKLALFDISNPSEPKVLDSKEFEDMSSPAQDTHLALTLNENAGYMAIPYNIHAYNDIDIFEEYIDEFAEPMNEDGVLLFGISKDSNKIEVYDKHAIGIGQILRSPYISDYIYAVNDKGEATGFKFLRQNRP